jgi:peptide/nickel transport system ATP-binding protein
MTSAPKPMLSVRHLRIGFVTDFAEGFGTNRKTLTAVDDISFDLQRGKTFALLGESGCGKSATAQALMRLLPAAGRYLGGQVLFSDGQDILLLEDTQLRQVRGRKIAMIFQEPATSLNPVLTVGDQIGEVLSLQRGLRGEAAKSEALSLLQQVGITDPERRLSEYPFQFSGGMKQRVMIAIALAGEPDILIADEPTTALDVTVQAQILDLLKRLQQQRGMAILLITHDLGVLSMVADSIGVMYAGQLVEVADRDVFFRQPQHPYSQALFAALPEAVQRGERLLSLPGQVPGLHAMPSGCRFADRCHYVMDTCRQASPEWQSVNPQLVGTEQRVRCFAAPISLGPNPNLAAAPALAKHSLAETKHQIQNSKPPVLTVDSLQVLFPIRKGFLQRTVGYVRAVDGVDLQLQPGKTMALVGESGCGKTTVGKAILQLIKPTAGTVRVVGQEWFGKTGSLKHQQLHPLRRHMQMVFQDPFASLNPRMRIGEILLEGLQAQGMNKTLTSARPALTTLLQQVGLSEESLDRFPHEFSGGQRQRIAIARALAVQPQIVICDEPTSALDVSVQAQILNLLRDLQQTLGLAYLFITHNFCVVSYLADEVAVMYLGRIVETGKTEEILQAPQHPYTQALLSAVPKIERGDKKFALNVNVIGELPSPAAPPKGCHFHPRCPKAEALCRESYPKQIAISSSHKVACFFATQAPPSAFSSH